MCKFVHLDRRYLRSTLSWLPGAAEAQSIIANAIRATVLHHLTAGFDGANPEASFVLGTKGVLYGVTNSRGGNQLGGSNYMPGTGTVFSIRP
jgi:hypothetical protein